MRERGKTGWRFVLSASSIYSSRPVRRQTRGIRSSISTRDQKLALLDRGNLMATYPVSTSKFGLGDRPGSRFTPLGQLQIAEKIGDNAPPGTVFKDRRRTGEVVLANSPGRDPIVTRILWLRGLEAQNANAFGRDIYIHGTPEEWKIGRPRVTDASECAPAT